MYHVKRHPFLGLPEDVWKTAERLLVMLLPGLIWGAVPCVLGAYAGAILGVVYQVAPCYSGHANHPWTERVAGGAVFGSLLGLCYLGTPLGVLSGIVGVIVTAVRKRRP
jgi:hypothetical protein